MHLMRCPAARTSSRDHLPRGLVFILFEMELEDYEIFINEINSRPAIQDLSSEIN